MISSTNTSSTPQCQYFVVRKKRLCRMTVRPGRQYCGEHEPQPKTEEGKDDTRIPCPYDPKHTCYESKLEKHLSICNARQTELPEYIERNINAVSMQDTCVRKPLSEISRETLMQVIEKVNHLFEKYIEGNIKEVMQRPIHEAVVAEFNEGDRTESSRRHLRQASSLLHLAEQCELVKEHSCYVELGAGKGQLCYYMGVWWCKEGTNSSVVAIDRAALRHKRDTKLRNRDHAPSLEHDQSSISPAPSSISPAPSRHRRVRADLADLKLNKVPEVSASKGVVGFAKHLCGVATDFALRCMTEPGVLSRARGLILATCCHHRCKHALYVGTTHLRDLGVSEEEFNIILGIVSWATCGDGRSRDRRRRDKQTHNTSEDHDDIVSDENKTILEDKGDDYGRNYEDLGNDEHIGRNNENNGRNTENNEYLIGGSPCRAEVGRRAKALLDWGRVLFLKDKGFDARLCYFVPPTVSLENVCLVATKDDR